MYIFNQHQQSPPWLKIIHSFIFRFHCLYRQSLSSPTIIILIVYTDKLNYHTQLNHPKNFFTWNYIIPRISTSRNLAETLWCNFHVGFPGSSSAIEITHHTPCINANQCPCVVLNPLAITCPLPWYSGNTIKTHTAPDSSGQFLFKLLWNILQVIVSLQQFQFSSTT